jgi:hypothetical protein
MIRLLSSKVAAQVNFDKQCARGCIDWAKQERKPMSLALLIEAGANTFMPVDLLGPQASTAKARHTQSCDFHVEAKKYACVTLATSFFVELIASVFLLSLITLAPANILHSDRDTELLIFCNILFAFVGCTPIRFQLRSLALDEGPLDHSFAHSSLSHD